MVVRASFEDLVMTKTFTGADAWYLRASIVAAGSIPSPGRQGQNGLEQFQGQLKAWKNIWSAGQGVDHIRAIEPVAAIVDRYAAEYAAALRKPAFGCDRR